MNTEDVSRWRIRVSRAPNPDAPRETLVMKCTQRKQRREYGSWTATTKNMRGKRHGGVGNTEADAIRRTVRNILKLHGWAVWAVVPPGEALADDGRPTPNLYDPPDPVAVMAFDAAEKGFGRFCTNDVTMPLLPKSVANAARKSMLVGARAFPTVVHTPDGSSFWQVSIRGGATDAIKEELHAAGFHQSGKKAIWYWPHSNEPISGELTPPPAVKRPRPTLRVVKGGKSP